MGNLNKGTDGIGEGYQTGFGGLNRELGRTGTGPLILFATLEKMGKCNSVTQEIRQRLRLLLKLVWDQSGDEAQNSITYMKSDMPKNFHES